MSQPPQGVSTRSDREATAHESISDLWVLYAQRHGHLARHGQRAGREFALVNRKLWFDLRADDVECTWAYDDHFHVDFAVSEAEGEAFLRDTFVTQEGVVTDELLAWRRINKVHFCYLAAQYLAARELATNINARHLAFGSVKVPIDPGNVRILGMHFADDSFGLFLKAMVPSAVFVDENSGRILEPDDGLSIRFALGFNASSRATIEQVGTAGALVSPIAIGSSWETLVTSPAEALLVQTPSAPEGMRPTLRDYLRVAFSSRRRSLKRILRRSVNTRARTIQLGIGSHPAEILIRVRDLAGGDMTEIASQWVTRLLVPNLVEVRELVRVLLLRASPSQVIVCDAPFPENAVLAEEAIQTGIDVVLLPHSPTPTEVDLWGTGGIIHPMAATRNGVKFWNQGGEDATLRPDCLPTVSRAASSPATQRDRMLRPIRILYLGGLSHEQSYPVFDPTDYFAALDTILSAPIQLRGEVAVAVKPRPFWEDTNWYAGVTGVHRMIKQTVPLATILMDYDVVVCLELSSGALLEAIGFGCIAVAVSSDPSDPRWQSERFARIHSVVDSTVVPVVEPAHYWTFIESLVKEPQVATDLRMRQRKWLREQLDTASPS